MTRAEVDKLISPGTLPGSSGIPELLETHISWVLLCNQFVFKIKKPLVYSFLDFSTLEKRKSLCEKEVYLNARLTAGIYIDVLPVVSVNGRIFISDDTDPAGEIIDYAVRMNKVDRSRQMDILLLRNEVSESDITKLAKKVALFHCGATIIYEKNVLKIREEFDDLEGEKTNLAALLATDAAEVINRAVAISHSFIDENKSLLCSRLKAGYYRDGHGDLHSRNIFLLDEPQPFDCIEFNDEYRQIDLLNELAFLSMDLDAFGRNDLSDLFVKTYNNILPVIASPAERQLFIYYKSYRANVRAKVNSLRLRNCTEEARPGYQAEAEKYLALMDNYLKRLNE
jgi:uncharacterized protein